MCDEGYGVSYVFVGDENRTYFLIISICNSFFVTRVYPGFPCYVPRVCKS